MPDVPLDWLVLDTAGVDPAVITSPAVNSNTLETGLPVDHLPPLLQLQLPLQERVVFDCRAQGVVRVRMPDVPLDWLVLDTAGVDPAVTTSPAVNNNILETGLPVDHLPPLLQLLQLLQLQLQLPLQERVVFDCRAQGVVRVRMPDVPLDWLVLDTAGVDPAVTTSPAVNNNIPGTG
jgi:hypothetical protein